jgi:glycosyltransferase involved in cell wall biosynthesis
MPKVSIIITTYNRAPLLKRAISCALSQEYSDFDVLVIDDCSSDNTGEVVRDFSDNRIRYIRHSNNRGEAASRNTGIKESTGRYIAFLDSDDEWRPYKISREAEVLDNSSSLIGAVYCGLCEFRGNEKIHIPYYWVRKRQGDIYSELLGSNFISPSSILIKRECFDKVGLFDEAIRSFEDWDMWIRISRHYQFKYINEELVIKHFLADSVSANEDFVINGIEAVINKHYDELKINKSALSRAYQNIGHILFQQGQMRKGRDYIIRSMKTGSSSAKSIIMIIISLLGRCVYTQISKFVRRIHNINN